MTAQIFKYEDYNTYIIWSHIFIILFFQFVKEKKNRHEKIWKHIFYFTIFFCNPGHYYFTYLKFFFTVPTILKHFTFDTSSFSRNWAELLDFEIWPLCYFQVFCPSTHFSNNVILALQQLVLLLCSFLSIPIGQWWDSLETMNLVSYILGGMLGWVTPMAEIMFCSSNLSKSLLLEIL